jgi:O-antigen/teichoic acid export membrane protein
MAGFAAAASLTLLSQAWLLRRAILSSPAYRKGHNPGTTADFRRGMWVYARPFSSWGIFTWAQIASDRWALESFTTTQMVGIYQALYQLGYYPISMASTFLNQLVQPILFSRAGNGCDKERLVRAHGMIHKLFTAVLSLTIAGFLFSGLVCQFLFRNLLPPAYSSAAHLLPFIVLSAGIFECGQIMSLKHTVSHSHHKLIAPKIITAVLGEGLNFAGA